MNGSGARLNSTVAHVRSLDGEFYLCSEVADALLVSPATLRRLVVSDPHRLGPTRLTRFGGKTFPLYDTDDINRLAEAINPDRAGARRGRARLWDDDERRDRRRAHSAASYQRRRARTLAGRGAFITAAAASEHAETITASLADQLRRRQAGSPPVGLATSGRT